MARGLIKYDVAESDKYFNEALELLALNLKGGRFDKSDLITGTVYGCSNENLEEIFKKLNLQDKNVMTVGSSGDQMLYAIGKGAKKVTLIDGNPMSLPYAELKLACIKNLTCDEFYSCFRNRDIFYNSMEYYARVSHDLSPKSREFWDTIFLNYDNEDTAMGRLYGALFQSGRYKDWAVPGYLRHYTDEKSFNQIKENLSSCEIEFKYADFHDFARSVDDTYDLILLSNISDYVWGNTFYAQVYALRERLTKKGVMQIHYGFFGCDSSTSKVTERFARFSEDKLLEKYHNIMVSNRREELIGNGFYRFILKGSTSTTFVSRKYLDSHFKKFTPSKMATIRTLLEPCASTSDMEILDN